MAFKRLITNVARRLRESAGLDEKAKLGSGKRFAALKKEVAGEKGVRDPGAVAAAIGRKKYGAAKMQKMAHAHEAAQTDESKPDHEDVEAVRAHIRTHKVTHAVAVKARADHLAHLAASSTAPKVKAHFTRRAAAIRAHKDGTAVPEAAVVTPPEPVAAPGAVGEALSGFGFYKDLAHDRAKALAAKHGVPYHVHHDADAKDPKLAYGYARDGEQGVGKRVATYDAKGVREDAETAPEAGGFAAAVLAAASLESAQAPVAEAAEAPEETPSFLDRVLGAAALSEDGGPSMGARIMARAAERDAEEVAGVIVGAESAACALVEGLELVEMGADDHVVHVGYKLHSQAQAKHTVHHLIHHAMQHGAHAHDADGYDGHVAFHFKSKAHAEHFTKSVRTAAHVHRVVHHEPAYEALVAQVQEPAVAEGAAEVRVVPTVPSKGGLTSAVVHLTTEMGAASITLETLLHRYGGKPSAGGGWEFPAETAQAFLNEYMANGGSGYIAVPTRLGTIGRAGPNESVAEAAEVVAEGAWKVGGTLHVNGHAHVIKHVHDMSKLPNLAKTVKQIATVDSSAHGHHGAMQVYQHHDGTHSAIRMARSGVGKQHRVDTVTHVDPPAESTPAVRTEGVDHAAELHAKAPAAGFEKSATPNSYHLKRPGRTVTVRAVDAGARVSVHHDPVGTVAIPSRSKLHPSVDAALADAKAEHAKKMHDEA